MGLNKSTGNMYDWLSHTWNPIGGECFHNCSYCSTDKLMKRYPGVKAKYSGQVKLIEHELKTNFGKGKFIFVCAQHDLFARNIPDEWIERVIDHCKKYDNNYLFQTKNTKRLVEFTYKHGLPNKSTICTTIETDRWWPKAMGKTIYPHLRAMYMGNKLLKRYPKYVTIEPIMKFQLYWLESAIKMCNPIQVNIGADSGNNNLPEPNAEEIKELIGLLEKFTKVVQKKNLKRLLT